MNRTDFVARTSLGVLIQTFASRDLALVWAELEGDRFPGWTITKEVAVTTIRTTVLRRDRRHLRLINSNLQARVSA